MIETDVKFGRFLERVILALVVMIIAVAIESFIFVDLTWTAIALAAGLSVLAFVIVLVFDRDRAKRAEYEKIKARAARADDKVFDIAGSLRGQYRVPSKSSKGEKGNAAADESTTARFP